MSAPGADPLAAFRPVCRECGVTTGGGEFCYQHAPYTVWPLKDGTFRVDRNGRKRVEPVEPPASQWDTRESALRALVAQWRETGKQFRIRAISQLAMGTTWGCIAANAYDSSADAQFSMADALERLLSGPQP